MLFSTRRACPKCGRSFEELDPRLFSFNSKHGWCPSCYGTGLLFYGFNEEHTGEEAWWNEWFEGQERPCPDCNGARLRREALAVRFQGMNIAQMTAWSVAEAERHFRALKLRGREAEIARDIVAELRSRLEFLEEVGLPYLALDRAAPTLSGGEAQRIRLAAQLGSNLRGVCYILDEPTIGLHPRDNLMLLDTLHKLEAKGNTVVVVEHDEDTIRHAEHVVDLGPGAGVNGGRVVAEGTVEDVIRAPGSVTGKFLREPLRHPLVARASPRSRVAGPDDAELARSSARAAQPEESAREDSAGAVRVRDGRERQRQEHAGERCVASKSERSRSWERPQRGDRAGEDRGEDAAPTTTNNCAVAARFSARSMSRACWKWIRRPSARRRARVRRRTSGSGTTSASCLRARPRRRCAGTRPAGSRSTWRADAARSAKDRA